MGNSMRVGKRGNLGDWTRIVGFNATFLFVRLFLGGLNAHHRIEPAFFREALSRSNPCGFTFLFSILQQHATQMARWCPRSSATAAARHVMEEEDDAAVRHAWCADRWPTHRCSTTPVVEEEDGIHPLESPPSVYQRNWMVNQDYWPIYRDFVWFLKKNPQNLNLIRISSDISDIREVRRNRWEAVLVIISILRSLAGRPCSMSFQWYTRYAHIKW